MNVLKVMIVDDDFIVRRGMCDAIDWGAYGCEIVAQANDGVEALELIAEHLPDVVFCDVVMPRMNGLDLLERVQAQWPWIKMVMVSAHDESAYIRKALQKDAVDYLLKPFHEENIARVIEAVRGKISKEQVTLSTKARENPQLLLDVKLHMKAACQALEGYDHARAMMETRAMFYAIRAGSIQSQLLITSLCVELLVDIMHIPQQYGLTQHAQRIAERMSGITRHARPEDLEQAVLSAVDEIARLLDAEARPSARLAAQCRRLIEDNYGQNLTVTSLANQLHVSSNSLQNLFKRETGLTIRQHIIAVRMDKAKELLRTTQEKVYTIGASVGYQDPDFFTQTFVKYTGMTPQQYREAGA